MQREITQEMAKDRLPRREADANKGSFGSVLAAAGSMAYRGAAALCTEGALRAGAGLVYLASVEPVVQMVLTRTPECCACGCRTAANGGIHPQDAGALRSWFDGKNTVLLAGPGLGESAAPVCNALLGKKAPWSAAVLDADALNALAAGKIKGPLPDQTVITPHPGEAARLLDCTVGEVQADREAAARRLAGMYHCIAVLKGRGTLIATPGGEVYHNPTGSAGLAKGGSGDILAGLLSGLLAAGLKQGRAAEDAAIAAVWGRVPVEAMRQVGSTFTGVEHRIEPVRTLDGVTYYNDSIASSPTRTIAGLRSFDQKIILIAGGYDKKIPYEPLAPEVLAHVKTLVLMGATGPRIEKAVRECDGFAGSGLTILHADSMQHAVELARGAAKPGDVVSLSPASASFDLYPNFEVRGRDYKNIVKNLK